MDDEQQRVRGSARRTRYGCSPIAGRVPTWDQSHTQAVDSLALPLRQRPRRRYRKRISSRSGANLMPKAEKVLTPNVPYRPGTCRSSRVTLSFVTCATYRCNTVS